MLEKANRLKRLKEELAPIDKELEDLKLLGATLKERLQTLQKELPEQKDKAATVHYRRNHAQKLFLKRNSISN